MEKDRPWKHFQRKVGVSTLILDEIDFGAKKIIRGRY
jgi:hypothetical protein